MSHRAVTVGKHMAVAAPLAWDCNVMINSRVATPKFWETIAAHAIDIDQIGKHVHWRLHGNLVLTSTTARS